MKISSILGMGLVLAAGAGLSACETTRGAQADFGTGFAHIRTALENFADAQPVKNPDQPATVTAEAPGNTACPDVRIVQDLNQVHQFADPDKPSQPETISTVRMAGVQDSCKIVKNNMTIDMDLAFEGSIGPKAKRHSGDKPSFAYPYFVAITNNQGSIIAKEVFAVTMAYHGNATTQTRSEQIRQAIPLNDPNQKNYKVLIGFQLSEQELAYNRNVNHETMLARSADVLSNIAPAAGEEKQ